MLRHLLDKELIKQPIPYTKPSIILKTLHKLAYFEPIWHLSGDANPWCGCHGYKRHTQKNNTRPGELISLPATCPRARNPIAITPPRNKLSEPRIHLALLSSHARDCVFISASFILEPHYLFCVAAGAKVTPLPISGAARTDTCLSLVGKARPSPV